MAKKRSKINEDIFAPTKREETEDTAEETQEEPETKQALYYLPAELKDAVAQRATRLGIPASQLATFLLSDGLRRLDQDEIDPSPYLLPSDSPRFRHNLDLSDWYYSGK